MAIFPTDEYMESFKKEEALVKKQEPQKKDKKREGISKYAKTKALTPVRIICVASGVARREALMSVPKPPVINKKKVIVPYLKANKHRSGFNVAIWGDIDTLIMHWDKVKDKKKLYKEEHVFPITQSQWTSLAAYFDSVKNYGDTKFNRMIKEQLSIKNDTIDEGLFSVATCDIIPEKKSKEDMKKLNNKWNKRLTREG